MDQENEKKNSETFDKLCEQIEKKIKELTTSGVQQTNVDYISKLVDIKKDISEMKGMEENKMMYRGYDNYGTYDNYGGGRRRDAMGRYMEAGRGSYGRKYRGHEMIEDIDDNYGRYMEGRERGGSYGSPETDKAFDYMLQSAEDFFNHLFEESDSPEQMEKIKRAAKRISEKRM